MKTTIKEWLESIPDETIRNQALENTSLVQYKGYSSSLSSAITRAFVWSGSPEGHEYWAAFKKGLRKKKSPAPFKKQIMTNPTSGFYQPMPNLNGFIYAPDKPFTGFKVAPCRMTGPDEVGRCEPNEAEFWGLYTITTDQEDNWMADFQTEAQASAFRELLESTVSNHMTAVFVATIDHMHGSDTYISKTMEGLTDQIHKYVLDNWESDDKMLGTPPTDKSEAIARYFSYYSESIEYFTKNI